MQAPVDRYVTALGDSAWAGITLQHIADMASGIDCLDSDGYQDNSTCVYAMEESLGITAPTRRDLDFMTVLKSMQMHRESGRRNEYVSANTNVLALVIEAVTGTSYAESVEELVWGPIGAEADALMAISSEGYAYASGGLHARLRDVARFGQVFTGPGAIGVLSSAMVKTMQTGGIALDDSDAAIDAPERASWQWDEIWADGAMFKGGYSGQGLYVDPSRDLVIAWFGTARDYDTGNSMLPVSRQLAHSGLFAAQEERP
jgi:CubicO group peptidase (beta-lactamase class C family)